MFKRSVAIPIKSSASLTSNNLSISIAGKNILSHAIISRHFVNLTITDLENNVINNKQIISKISKDGKSAATGATDGCPTLLQTKFIEFSNKSVLVICTTKAIYIYDADGANLMFFHTLNQLKPSVAEGTVYTRGITKIEPNLIAVGTSTGSILVIEIPSKGTNVSVIDQLQEKNFNYGITDLITDDENRFLCAGDTKGNLAVWALKSDGPKLMYILQEPSGFTCTSLETVGDYLIAAFGNGTISIYQIKQGKKLIDIAAHARWIHAISVKNNFLASVSEDCYLRIWQLNEINNQFEVKFIQSEHIADSILTGVKFSPQSPNKLFVTCYDNLELLAFEKS